MATGDHREHPDIEVRPNLAAYASYFDTLRTDVAGGGADDIFWINNSHFAEYADNGRLMPNWVPHAGIPTPVPTHCVPCWHD